MDDSYRQIETWMFRENNEVLYLFLTIIIVLILGGLLAVINFYILVGALLFGVIYIKLQQAQLIGNALEVTGSQFPEIYSIFEAYKSRLGLNRVNLYIYQDPNPNAFTIGFPTGSIILASSLVENFSEEELHFILAHELGHVKAKHNIILTFVNPLGNSVPGSSLIFSFWRRKAEYTADKCGLILTKKLDFGITSLLKLTIGLHLAKKVKLESYKNQLVRSHSGMVKISEWLFDHPLTTNRVNKMVYFWRKNFVYQ